MHNERCLPKKPGDVEMNQITEELYIGNWKDVININPKTCLCVASDLEHEIRNVATPSEKNIIKTVTKIGLHDGIGNNKKTLFLIFDKMEEIIKNHGTVLVFCVKGESRSALCILAFLHLKRGWDIPKAYKHLRLTRKEVKLNPYLSLMFMELLNFKYFTK